MSRRNLIEGWSDEKKPNVRRKNGKNTRREYVFAETGPQKQVASVLRLLIYPETAGRATRKVVRNASNLPAHAGGAAGYVVGAAIGGFFGGLFSKNEEGGVDGFIRKAIYGAEDGAEEGGELGYNLGRLTGLVVTLPVGVLLKTVGAPVAGAAARIAVRELNNTKRKARNVSNALIR